MQRTVPRSPWRAALGWLLPATLASWTGIAAQTAPFVETVDVGLVLIDLLATGDGGRPVLDLEREELRLFVDGKPTEITQFTAPQPTPTHQKETGTRYVIFIDELHLGFGSRQQVLLQIAESLESMPADAQILLTSLQSGVVVEVPFTRDRKRILEALQEKFRAAPPQMVEGFAERRVLELLPQVLRSALPASDLELPCSAYLGPMVRSYAEQTRAKVDQAISALTGLISSLGGFSGPKVLFHVSDGIPVLPGRVAFEYAIELCDGSLAQRGEARSILPELESTPPATTFPVAARMEMLSYDTTALWRRLNAHANSHRVTFYTLQASGIQAPWASNADGPRTSARTESADRTNDQDSLFFMADETGGRAILDTNDFRSAIARVAEESTLRYELAFEPDPSPGEHTVRLEVERDGLRLAYRKSYRYLSAADRTGEKLLTTLLHGVEENRLEARIAAWASNIKRRGKVPVTVTLTVPLRRLTLIPSDSELHGRLSVMMAASDEQGSRTGIGEKTLELAIDPDDVAKEVYRYEVSLELPNGHDYRVAAAIGDLLGGEASYLSTHIGLGDR